MNSQATTMINDLFEKLRQAEAQNSQREAEIEAHIRSAIEAQPGAPYYMAQTILVQEQALQSLNQRVQELEQQLQNSKPASGGFLGGLFGGGSKPAAARTPATTQPATGTNATGTNAAGTNAQAGAFRNAPQGSFLGGAMQTAMGVAGGVMLANAVTGMFADEAEAAPAPAEEPAPEEDPGMAMDGGDDWGSDMDFDDDF